MPWVDDPKTTRQTAIPPVPPLDPGDPITGPKPTVTSATPVGPVQGGPPTPPPQPGQWVDDPTAKKPGKKPIPPKAGGVQGLVREITRPSAATQAAGKMYEEGAGIHADPMAVLRDTFRTLTFQKPETEPQKRMSNTWSRISDMLMMGGSAGLIGGPGEEAASAVAGRVAERARAALSRGVKPAVEQVADLAKPTPITPQRVDAFQNAIEAANKRAGEKPGIPTKPETPAPPKPGAPGKRPPRDEWFQRPGAQQIGSAPNPTAKAMAEQAALARSQVADANLLHTPLSAHARTVDETLDAMSEEGGYNVNRMLQGVREGREVLGTARGIEGRQMMMESSSLADTVRMRRMLESPATKGIEDPKAIYEFGENPVNPSNVVSDSDRNWWFNVGAPLRNDISEIGRQVRAFAEQAAKEGDTDMAQWLTEHADSFSSDEPMWMPRVDAHYPLGQPMKGRYAKVASSFMRYNRYIGVEPDGTKAVIGWKDGTLYKIDENGKATALGPSAQRPKFGDTVSTKGGTYVIKRGTKSEIESLSPFRYHDDVAGVLANKWLDAQRAWRATQFIWSLKHNEDFLRYALDYSKTEGGLAAVKMLHPNWTNTTFLPFRTWLMEPKFAAVLDRAASRGNDLAYFEDLNHTIVQLNFAMPTVHDPNILQTWATTMMQQVIRQPGTVPAAVGNMVRAFRDVLTMNERYENLLRAGHPGMFARARGYEYWDAQMRKSMSWLAQNPEGLRELANIMKMPTNQAMNVIHRMGAWGAWFLDDVGRSYIVYQLETAGKSTEEAVRLANRWIPDYRAATFFNLPSGRAGEAAGIGLGKALRHPFIAIFNGFHQTNLKAAVAAIPRSANAEEVLNGMSRLMAMGIMWFGALPAADAYIQRVLGNPDWHERRAGIYGPIDNTLRLFEGQMSLPHYLMSLVTPGPAMDLAMEAWTGKDPYTGKALSGPLGMASSVIYPLRDVLNRGLFPWLLGTIGVQPKPSTGAPSGRPASHGLPTLHHTLPSLTRLR